MTRERTAIIGDCARCWLKGVELDHPRGICGSCGDELREEGEADEARRILEDFEQEHDDDDRAEAAYQEHLAEAYGPTGSHGAGELIR